MPEPYKFRRGTRGTVGPIEKALIDAKLGISPVVTGELIRLPVPELSGERREELCKMAQGLRGKWSDWNVRASRKDGLDALKSSAKRWLA